MLGMDKRVLIGGLQIARPLYELISQEVLPGIDNIDEDELWNNFNEIVRSLAPENKKLLLRRVELQNQLNAWHLTQGDDAPAPEKYKKFLLDIGYLLPEGDNFEITTDNVDDEIATIAGPQLVVPVNNARYALNAANARWGSLYDALYGTDVIPEEAGLEKTACFNETRGRAVIELGFEFLDQAVPLRDASYKEAFRYTLVMSDVEKINPFQIELKNGQITQLQDSSQFLGFREQGGELVILLANHGLHIEMHIDAGHPIGKLHPSGIKDIVLESAITTIQDCEDSVAAVDAEDKTLVYRNWLGLMRGDLQEVVEKKGRKIIRKLNADRIYTTIDGNLLILPGRSLMLIRNVGHLMTTDAILTESGDEVPEGILDCMMTSLIALYDLQGKGQHKNSQKNSVYIVKPKMHGPEEVAFASKVFSRVEEVLQLPRYTLKIGIMDEERRTTVNLKECIRAAKERIIFINTGFLDRTGDEIHTSMEAGAFLPKSAIKNEPWIKAYEDWNVDIGLLCGLQGKAQIGKGMWAMPDLMKQMLEEKIVHPEMGANCAWVPSPTAATLHVTHYHKINVTVQQQQLKSRQRARLDDILSIPLLKDKALSDAEIQQELDNNAQSILGYVVRWIEQGVGCSKVPDINNVGLMEDRATLRISSQHMANWLHHNICSVDRIIETFKRMAVVVDRQNAADLQYIKMAPEYSGIAFHAALELVLQGCEQPNGYTEPLLHRYRKEFNLENAVTNRMKI